jgi:hypothetical protein
MGTFFTFYGPSTLPVIVTCAKFLCHQFNVNFNSDLGGTVTMPGNVAQLPAAPN